MVVSPPFFPPLLLHSWVGLSLAAFLLWAVASNASDSSEATSNRANDIYFNYHITHHAGTALYQFISHQLIWDGMNGMYNIPLNDKRLSKEWVYENWSSDVNYTIRKSDHFIYPIDMYSRHIRPTMPVDVKLPMNECLDGKVKSGRRQFLEVEQILTADVWNALPIDHPNIRSMIVLKNPALRAVSAGRDYKDFVLKHGEHLGPTRFHVKLKNEHNYALRWLSGHTFGIHDENAKQKAYEVAVQRLHAFEHIVIAEAMPETTYFFCKEWKWERCKFPTWNHKHPVHPKKRFFNDTFFSKFLENDEYNFKLYDTAIAMAKEKMVKNGENHTELDSFPLDSQAALLSDLNENTTLCKCG